jgi:hypothetical protein
MAKVGMKKRKIIKIRSGNAINFYTSLTLERFHRVCLDRAQDVGRIVNRLPFAVQLLNQMRNMSEMMDLYFQFAILFSLSISIIQRKTPLPYPKEIHSSTLSAFKKFVQPSNSIFIHNIFCSNNTQWSF